tara:strand:- start:8436 stop:9059 length:624 start_codon:yes stop_codon:yes gene_type:complete
MHNVENLKKRYDKHGTIMFDLERSFFSDDDFKNLEELFAKLPYEYVSTGDAGEDNSVEVGRLMTDIKNPKVVNESIANLALKILNKEKHLNFYKKLLNRDELHLRRVQVNKMHKDAFVGYHLDIDSNPDYLAAVVVQFGRDFKGGDYIVYEDKKDDVGLCYAPFYQSMIISNCNNPHEVTKIEKGTRISLVFFLCEHKGENLRNKTT